MRVTGLENDIKAARDIIRDALVWDNHACMPLRPGDTRFLDQLERFREAGVNVVSLNVSMDMIPWHDAFKVLATMRSYIQARPDRYLLCTDRHSIESAKASGRLAVAFDIEGGAAVDDLPDLIEVYYALGVRWMLVAYNRANRLGSGGQEQRDTGLTPFGRRVIDRMAEVGMVLCCSHTGEATATEAIEYNPNPTIFSHSNAAAVHAHTRNISDDLIRACAKKSGVIGLVGLAPFISAAERASVQTLADHADHIAQIAGPAHIGLGLDYVFDPNEIEDFLPKYAAWFPGLSRDAPFPDMLGPDAIEPLVEILVQRGWRHDDVAAMLGGNLLRVAHAVWK